MPEIYFGGLDFGSSGARISIINENKELIYTDSNNDKYALRKPQSWRISCESLLNNLAEDIKKNIFGLAISGTSGTLLACDFNGCILGDAIPYNELCIGNKNLIEAIAGESNHLKTPYSSLAKALTLIDKYGENILLRHQSDWITGILLNSWQHGEEGNNIKLGWNLEFQSWPKNFKDLSWKKCLPSIVQSGAILGSINSHYSKKLNLNKNLLIVAGSTDSNAAFIASQIDKRKGLTILGTTIVLKKIVNKPINYLGVTNHRINNKWICGGSSNAGCGILSQFFSDNEIKELSRQLNTSKKTNLSLLPLNGIGERFPINDPFLKPILEPRPVSDALYLKALFEGLASIELKGWRKIEELTGSFPEKIVTIGGGAKNPQWRSIRERILNIPIVTCRKSSSFGAAILAMNAKK